MRSLSQVFICHYGVKATIDKTGMSMALLQCNFSTEQVAGWIWPMGCYWPTPDLDEEKVKVGLKS